MAARTVREIMNPQLLSLHGPAPANEALDMILEYGVTAVPVLDAEDRPVGVTSLRDLVRVGVADAPVTSPATTVALNASVASAAETMATTGRHHLVVVGADGRAVGMVSTLDVIRALLGYPVKHPPTFPQQDPLGASWSNDQALDEKGLDAVPHEPGVLLLLRGGREQDQDRVWAETATDLHERANDLVTHRVAEAESLELVLRERNLRMRYAVESDPSKRASLARRVQELIEHTPPPGST